VSIVAVVAPPLGDMALSGAYMVTQIALKHPLQQLSALTAA
jgi:hypothetical protein